MVEIEQSGRLQNDSGTKDARRTYEKGAQANDDPIRRAQVGGTFAAAIQDQQLMANQHVFGNHTPETAGLCQPNQSDERMNEKDDELAHSGNGIKASKRPIEPFFVIRHGHLEGPRSQESLMS
jgi:hypothetical protein